MPRGEASDRHLILATLPPRARCPDFTISATSSGASKSSTGSPGAARQPPNRGPKTRSTCHCLSGLPMQALTCLSCGSVQTLQVSRSDPLRACALAGLDTLVPVIRQTRIFSRESVCQHTTRLCRHQITLVHNTLDSSPPAFTPDMDAKAPPDVVHRSRFHPRRINPPRRSIRRIRMIRHLVSRQRLNPSEMQEGHCGAT